MASYGVFLTACGFEHHGPKGRLGFAPRLTPEQFRCPFTTAEGWGTFSQQIADGKQQAKIALKFGQLRLTTLALAIAPAAKPAAVSLIVAGKPLPATFSVRGARVEIKFSAEVMLRAGETLEVVLAS